MRWSLSSPSQYTDFDDPGFVWTAADGRRRFVVLAFDKDNFCIIAIAAGKFAQSFNSLTEIPVKLPSQGRFGGEPK
jgi:hypothetical protein